jgi:hypothetical protein
LKTLTLSCLLVIATLVGASVLAQDDESEVRSVESLMAPEDYQASGLGKLSEAERAHLSEWLERYREGAVQGPEVPRKPSQWTEEEKQAEKDFRIVAKVLPRFRGWTGKTVFRLDNGQTWQQRMPGRFAYNGSNSEIVISKNVMGRYVLEHVESERSVLIKRVE